MTSDAPLVGRRPVLLGAGAVGAGLMVGGCVFFGDDKDPERTSYGDADSQFGDLYTPGGSEPWPVIAVLHGGAWREDVDLSIIENACKDLRDRGYAVWSLEYRRMGEDGGGFPGTFADVAAGIDHLTTLAEDRPLDLGRLLVLGHSAGGTLALWSGARSGLPDGAPGANPALQPAAVMSLAGVTDLATCASRQQLEGACSQLLGGEPDTRADRYALTSPIERLPLGTSQTIIHGRNDTVVPVDQAQAYADAARAAGDDLRLTLLDDANHFTLIDTDNKAWAAVIAELDRLRL